MSEKRLNLFHYSHVTYHLQLISHFHQIPQIFILSPYAPSWFWCAIGLRYKLVSEPFVHFSSRTNRGSLAELSHLWSLFLFFLSKLFHFRFVKREPDLILLYQMNTNSSNMALEFQYLISKGDFCFVLPRAYCFPMTLDARLLLPRQNNAYLLKYIISEFCPINLREFACSVVPIPRKRTRTDWGKLRIPTPSTVPSNQFRVHLIVINKL